jgi:outer membrane biosynthesis protein TonB
MFPVTITVTNQAELRAVMSVLHPIWGELAVAAKQEVATKEAEKVEAPKSEPAPVAKPEAAPIPPTVESPAAPEPKAESSAVTFEDLKKAFLDLAKVNREAAVKLLADNGCAKLTEAKPEQFATLHAAILGASV